jgi:hypothetical protein
MPVLNEGPSLQSNVGSALNDLLMNLAASKTKQHAQGQTAKGLQGLGYTPEISTALSQFDPQLLNTVLKEYQPQSGGQGGVESSQERKTQHLANKESSEYLKEVAKGAKSAKESEVRLDKMTRLIERGKLPTATFYNLLKDLEELSPVKGAAAGAGIGAIAGGGLNPITGAIGGAVGGLISPIASLLRSGQRLWNEDQELFEKLSAEFVRDAKSIFGSRITDADLTAFMQMVPTLGNTDQGKRKIIDNLKEFNRAALIKDKIAKELIKSNGGKRPANLQLLVDEVAEPALDKYAEDFRNSLRD